MSFDYSGIQSTGLSLINEFGRSCVLKRITEGTFNPSTGTVTGASSTNENITAVFTDYNERQIDGNIIVRGDKLVLIAGTITEPKNNDEIDDWKIINIETVETGDTPLLYKAQVRR